MPGIFFEKEEVIMNPEDFHYFKNHFKEFLVLMRCKAFDTKNGKIILHFNDEGFAKLERDYMLWKKE